LVSHAWWQHVAIVRPLIVASIVLYLRCSNYVKTKSEAPPQRCLAIPTTPVLSLWFNLTHLNRSKSAISIFSLICSNPYDLISLSSFFLIGIRSIAKNLTVDGSTFASTRLLATKVLSPDLPAPYSINTDCLSGS
jgi:hypothetical protein